MLILHYLLSKYSCIPCIILGHIRLFITFPSANCRFFSPFQLFSIDAVHSLSDLIADGMTLLTVKKSRQDPNDLYPFFHLHGLTASYGHGKVEALGAMGIACFLVGTSLLIGWDSYLALKDILVNGIVNDYGASNDLLTYFVCFFVLHSCTERSWRFSPGDRVKGNTVPGHKENRGTQQIECVNCKCLPSSVRCLGIRCCPGRTGRWLFWVCLRKQMNE